MGPERVLVLDSERIAIEDEDDDEDEAAGDKTLKFDPDICRSLLFVPAGNERYLESALRGSADVIQIDLEDAIPPDQKDPARKDAKSAIDRIHANERIGVVRVNNDPSLLTLDLEAVVRHGLAGLTIPKVTTADDLKRIDKAVANFEQVREMPLGDIRLIAQIESAAGVLNAREIANATPRLMAIGLGMEDLAADVGSSVAPDALYFPSMQTLYAAREAGVVPIGYLGSITVYNDPKTFRGWIRRAKSLGFEGGFCIHPNQVEILNAEFAPSADEVTEAKALLEAMTPAPGIAPGIAAGSAPFSYQGRMVDKPVIERAHRTLKRHISLTASQ